MVQLLRDSDARCCGQAFSAPSAVVRLAGRAANSIFLSRGSAADIVALFRAGDDVSAVWHVDISPATPLPRLCGAWITDDTNVLGGVVASRLLLPFGGRLDAEAATVADAAIGIVDPAATLAAVGTKICALDTRHRSSKTAAGTPRAPIDWPDLPPNLDWAALPDAPAGVNPEPFVAEVISVARWVTKLAEAWSAVEVARTSRPHLAGDNLTLQPLPIALG